MIQSCLDQLNKWVEGVSEHNKERNECCPDFSCCNPSSFIKDRKVREVFRDAYVTGNRELIDKLLGMFLSESAVTITDVRVYIAGDAGIPEV